MNMPLVDRSKVSGLTDEEIKIFNIVVKKDDRVRASKPKVTDYVTGKAAYVWRMVCFMVSPKPAHSCMPVCAEFDLPSFREDGSWSAALAREMAKTLDPLVDKIVDAVNKLDWHGIRRWGRVL